MADYGSVISEFLGRFPSIFNGLVRLVHKLPTIEKRTIVDLASNESAVKFQLLDNGDIQIMLRVSNYTPFTLKAQNITLDLVWFGLNKKIRQTNYETIPKHSEKIIFLREELSSENIQKIINAIKKNHKIDYISYKIDFENSLYSFQKSGSFNNFPLKITNLDSLEKGL